MRKAYIYPTGISRKDSNPYISDFVDSLSSCISFINRPKVSKVGILDMYFYLGKIDIIFLNWIEDLPDKKFGFIQSLFFIPLILLLKLKGVSIFYTLHNKESHYKTRNALKNMLRKLVLIKADYILFHSTEGYDILKTFNLSKGVKLYFPHPFKNSIPLINKPSKKYDILMWGSIKPYKGIDSYLKFISAHKLQHKYKTLIIGEISPIEYENELKIYSTNNIEIINEVIPTDKLNDLIDESRIILFTYKESSVLSSGALIYSLSRRAEVIGPNTGAFRDIGNEGIIEVYNDFEELINKMDNMLESGISKKDRITEYITENTWINFGKWLESAICSN